jgi:phosphoenolpyruvate carboxylase
MTESTECSDVRKVERNPSPIEQEIRAALLQEILEAATRNNQAAREFYEVMGRFPSGLPHPEGVERIKNASYKLTVARKEMTTALNRLHDYLQSRSGVLDRRAEPI